MEIIEAILQYNYVTKYICCTLIKSIFNRIACSCHGSKTKQNWRRGRVLQPTEMPVETDEAAAPALGVDAQLLAVPAGTATGTTAGSSKMKTQKNGLKPLRIPKREMSYTLKANACGLATFSYKARDPISGQLAEHTLAERGEKGYSLNALAIGPELGHGQGGCVRLSRHEVTGVDYALKEVSIADDGTRHQVMRELAVYRQCQSKRKHPNIVSLFDAFYAEGRVYMVLELMTWGSLELALLHRQQQHASATRAAQKEQGVRGHDAPEHGDSASKSSHAYDERGAHAGEGVVSPPAGPRRFGGIEEAVLAGVAGRVLQALAFLFNEHAVVHRDIKPGNVMLSRDGSVKLGDFGVSICGAGDTDHVAGTAGYMSPERLEGNVCEHRGDIWAVGIMLLECAKGRHPLIDDRWEPISSFPGDEVQGVVKTMQRSESGTHLMPLTHCDVWAKVVKDDAPSACGLGYSEDLESFVAACLKKDKVFFLCFDEICLNHCVCARACVMVCVCIVSQEGQGLFIVF
jgi:serine/threonine protein kinase